MNLLDFVVLMSVADMSAMADLEALLLYVVAPMTAGFFILLMLMPSSNQQKNEKLMDAVESKLISSKNSTEEIAA